MINIKGWQLAKSIAILLFCQACSNSDDFAMPGLFPSLYNQLKQRVDISQPDEAIDFAKVFIGLDRQFNKLGIKTNPPLTEADIAKLEKELPCRLPDSLKAVYQWHNGIESLLSPYDFLSLAEMVKEYHHNMKMNEEYGLSEEEGGWPRYFLPIMQFNGTEFIVLDCKLATKNPLFDYSLEDPTPSPMYRGVGHLLAVTLTAYETGAYEKQENYIHTRLITEMKAFRQHATRSELQAIEENWTMLKKPFENWQGADFQSAVSWAVNNMADERMIPLLQKRLYDKNPKTVAHAAFALGNLQANETLPDLTKLLLHSSKEVRNFAGGALSEFDYIDSEITIDRLIFLLNDPEDMVRISAIEALGKTTSSKSVLPLLELLAKSRPGIQQYIIGTLANIGDKRALPTLQQLQATVSRMDLNAPDLGGTRGSDPPPVRLKAQLDNAIQQLGG